MVIPPTYRNHCGIFPLKKKFGCEMIVFVGRRDGAAAGRDGKRRKFFACFSGRVLLDSLSFGGFTGRAAVTR